MIRKVANITTSITKCSDSDKEGLASIKATDLNIQTSHGPFYILFFSVILWVVLATVMGGKVISNSTVCESSYKFQHWTTYLSFAEMCAFFGNATSQSIRLFNEKWTCDRRSVHVILLATLIINTIAGISSLLDFVFRYGGVCQDLMGYVDVCLRFLFLFNFQFAC